MKLSSVFFAAGILFAACKKENAPQVQPVVPSADTTTTVFVRGSFSNGPYGQVTGTAKVITVGQKYQLQLDSFSTSSGPDLHVYLSQEIQPIHFIELGKLKSVSGVQVYDIPGKPDFGLYRYALIHCQEYNHLFGVAQIQ